jgi:putative addiction module component (TIGR02574 family)
MSDYAEILSAAVQLPPAERELLIEELSATLMDEEAVKLSPEWIEEIDRRSAEIDAGAVELVDWETIRMDLLKRVGLEDRA